jgi:flagellar FliJ protein
MPKDPKPGKVFKYGLETVLKVREIKEKKEQEKFAERKRKYLEEKEREEQLKEKQRQRRNELKNIMRGGFIDDMAGVIRRKAHLGVLKEDISKQVDKVLSASRELDKQRSLLIEAMKGKKIIQKDRERKYEQYQKMMQKLEMNFLDEVATERFTHEKFEREGGGR